MEITRKLAAVLFTALFLAACSADDATTTYPEDTVFTGSTIEVDDVEVVDGTEDGVD